MRFINKYIINILLGLLAIEFTLLAVWLCRWLLFWRVEKELPWDLQRGGYRYRPISVHNKPRLLWCFNGIELSARRSLGEHQAGDYQVPLPSYARGIDAAVCVYIWLVRDLARAGNKTIHLGPIPWVFFVVVCTMTHLFNEFDYLPRFIAICARCRSPVLQNASPLSFLMPGSWIWPEDTLDEPDDALTIHREDLEYDSDLFDDASDTTSIIEYYCSMGVNMAERTEPGEPELDKLVVNHFEQLGVSGGSPDIPVAECETAVDLAFPGDGSPKKFRRPRSLRGGFKIEPSWQRSVRPRPSEVPASGNAKYRHPRQPELMLWSRHA